MGKEEILELYKEEITEIFKENKFVVFLCGPSIKNTEKPGAQLRKQIMEALQNDKFEVFLGEDDGLEELQEKFGLDAQENEMSFIAKYCNAIVLIASSIGAYCELGLFSYYKVKYSDSLDFILIISEEYKGEKSYLNLGPAAVVDSHGKVYYADLGNFNIEQIVKRLQHRRAAFFMDSRGKPPGKRT